MSVLAGKYSASVVSVAIGAFIMLNITETSLLLLILHDNAIPMWRCSCLHFLRNRFLRRLPIYTFSYDTYCSRSKSTARS
ncbi:MAG: hypothetical protein Q9187_002600 [Circinaria calcarea]